MIDSNDRQILLDSLRQIPDYPKAGILFWDITTLLNNQKAFHILLDHLYNRYKDMQIDCIVGAEARGFIFGAALSARLKNRFIPIRKPNKLPYTTISEKYALEYGNDQVEIHLDSFATGGKRVLFIDDLIATGGTAVASINLIQKAGGECIEACFVVDLVQLGGSDIVKKIVPVYSVLEV